MHISYFESANIERFYTFCMQTNCVIACMYVCCNRNFCLTNKIYSALKYASEGFVIHSVSFDLNSSSYYYTKHP